MDNLPEAFSALKNYKQFVIYEIVPSTSRPGKTDKFPLHYLTYRKINPHEEYAWTDFDTASATARKLGKRYGVGFALTSNDPFWFLDIDNCGDGKGTWSDISKQLVTEFLGAAVEVSSSGRGLHILGSGYVPEHGCTNKQYDLEFYTQKRFIALTGLHTRGNISCDFSFKLPWLVDTYFPPKIPTNAADHWTEEALPEWNGPLDDETLINRALKSKSINSIFSNRASFADLWNANIEVLSGAYPDKYRDRAYDESSADIALAQHLAFWTGNNCSRIFNLMLQSKLVREKWNREDYLRNTILRACTLQKEYLCDKSLNTEGTLTTSSDTPQPVIKKGATYLTIDQQIELFKGCTYITDIHKILIPGGEQLKPEQFRVRYGGYCFTLDANNEKTTRNAWEAFTESQAFTAPRAMSSCFKPDITPGALIEKNGYYYVNTYWPIQTPRKQGGITPFLNHFAKMIPNERDRTILLSFGAALVQHPGIKFMWAPVIQGVEGNGKSLFSTILQFAVGSKYTHFITNAAELDNRFNDWMTGKILICIEDIKLTEFQQHIIEILKPMITSKYRDIEGKNKDKITLEICCNFIINTNHKTGLVKTRNDRRFAFFYTAQQSKEDLIRDGMTDDYFYKYYQWLEKEGFAIINEYLHTYKIPDDLNPAFGYKAPLTSSTDNAIFASLGMVEQEIIEAIEQGTPGFKGGWVSSTALDKLLEKSQLAKRIPRNRRRELMQTLNYDYHPALQDGRTNSIVMPDGTKPRLFVQQHNNELIELTQASDVAKRYSEDQLK